MPRPAPRPAPRAIRSDFLYEPGATDGQIVGEHVLEIICVTIVELPDEDVVELVELLVIFDAVP
jgi:hypothetical protein